MTIPWGKLKHSKYGFGRVEANYIATNPMIFERLKMGDVLVCVEQEEYFRMRDGIYELLVHIYELYDHINKLHDVIDPELIKEEKIQQLKKELKYIKTEK